jgi:hypothetical protein
MKIVEIGSVPIGSYIKMGTHHQYMVVAKSDAQIAMLLVVCPVRERKSNNGCGCGYIGTWIESNDWPVKIDSVIYP